MALTDKKLEKIADELYDKVEPEMKADEVFDIVDELAEKYDITDPHDYFLMGVFVGDAWRPVSDDELDDVDGDEEDL